MNVLFKADGTKTPAPPENGTDYELSELQGLVGGWIEVVNLQESGYILVVNEEGLLKGLPWNPAASAVAGMDIVGDAVLCPSDCLK